MHTSDWSSDVCSSDLAHNKNLLHSSVAPAHHRWSTSNARRGSDSLIGTQSSWPPFFLATAKMQKKNGHWCSTGLCLFDQTFQNLRPLSATMQHLLFCPFWRWGVPLFTYFSSFFALIRATLGFFVVFPNKSYTPIRATLGFECFVPDKSYTLIRATFRGF